MLLNSEYKNKRKSIFHSSCLIVFCIFIYALLSDPFIFSVFIALPLRALLLVIPILIIILSFYISYGYRFKIIFFVYLSVVLMYCLKNIDLSPNVVKISMQFAFLISLFSFAKQYTINELLIKVWFWLWSYIAICIVISFIIYQSGFFEFTPKYLLDNSSDADYYYNHIPFIGNFVNYNLLGFSVPKSSWYAFEPGMISFFFGFNALLSNYLKEAGLSKGKVSFFRYISLLGGFFTFSSTFILFLMAYFIYSMFKFVRLAIFKFLILITFASSISILFFTLFVGDGYLEATSFGDRNVRVQYAYRMLQSSNLFEVLFGNGLGSPVDLYGIGLASGFLSILVEQGLVFLITILVVVYFMLRGKCGLFCYFLFYLLTFNPVFYPMTAIGLYIAHVCNNRVNAKVDHPILG